MFLAAPDLPWLDRLAGAVLFGVALMFGVHRAWKRRHPVPPGTWSAPLAWQRALMYFGACVGVATFSGVLPVILTTPLATAAQMADPAWLALTAACVAVILAGYAGIWPIGTFTDGRKGHRLLTPAYGLVWGLCQGLLFLSVWALVERTGLGAWWVAGISYVLIGAYQGLWHNFFWDIHVSPPHNYRAWNARKVLLCHTPNLVVCLVYLALHGNAGIYVLLQGLALGISAWVMRFPAPWDDYTAVAGLQK
jgi:hypothetical protein